MLQMRRLLRAVPGILVIPMLSGCAALSAKGKAAELPPLSVPPPPPRVIEPTPEPLPEPVAELPTAPPTSTSTRGSSRATPPRPAPQPESKPPETNKPVEQPPTPADPAPPAPTPTPPAAQLRTPQTADTNNSEKAIRATLDSARGLLQNVDYRNLNNERKKAYDDSMRYMRQAEDAVKEGNLVFALSMAKKAETLAKELAGK
jgi:hypothetical protein